MRLPAAANDRAPPRRQTLGDVVFVELANRGQASKYKRVFLDRRAVTYPTDEL